MTLDAAGLEVLTEQDCLALLAEHPIKVGRVAFLHAGFPVVLPVNYRMDHGTAVFRTGLGTKLDSAASGSPLAFEVDHVDPQWREGWSVLLQGRGEEVVAPAELRKLHQLGIEPWSPGERSRYIRLRPERITGRRIV